MELAEALASLNSSAARAAITSDSAKDVVFQSAQGLLHGQIIQGEVEIQTDPFEIPNPVTVIDSGISVETQEITELQAESIVTVLMDEAMEVQSHQGENVQTLNELSPSKEICDSDITEENSTKIKSENLGKEKENTEKRQQVQKISFNAEGDAGDQDDSDFDVDDTFQGTFLTYSSNRYISLE